MEVFLVRIDFEVVAVCSSEDVARLWTMKKVGWNLTWWTEMNLDTISGKVVETLHYGIESTFDSKAMIRRAKVL